MSLMNWEEFLNNAIDFRNISDTHQDSWKIVEKDNNEGNTYLVYKQKIKIESGKVNDTNNLIDLETEEPHHDSSRVSEKIEELYEIEYHVVYSISYQVPVLYFKGYRSDGKPISLEDAWNIFQDPLNNIKSQSNMLSTLTQTDHPVLFTPFLGLHPCRTAELLKQMGISGNSILTFLSIMGPFVKLNLKNEYGLNFK